jgi:hypothetical protein
VKEIPLTQGQVALVDKDDFERVNAFKWYARWSPKANAFYAYRIQRENGKRNNIHIARFIMNTPKGMVVDHINGNPLDNRKINLRNCTQAQNSVNKHKTINKTGYRDIYKNGNTFRVTLRQNRIKLFDKCFRTIEEAIATRDEVGKKYHGEFYHE